MHRVGQSIRFTSWASPPFLQHRPRLRLTVGPAEALVPLARRFQTLLSYLLWEPWRRRRRRVDAVLRRDLPSPHAPRFARDGRAGRARTGVPQEEGGAQARARPLRPRPAAGTAGLAYLGQRGDRAAPLARAHGNNRCRDPRGRAADVRNVPCPLGCRQRLRGGDPQPRWVHQLLRLHRPSREPARHVQAHRRHARCPTPAWRHGVPRRYRRRQLPRGDLSGPARGAAPRAGMARQRLQCEGGARVAGAIPRSGRQSRPGPRADRSPDRSVAGRAGQRAALRAPLAPLRDVARPAAAPRLTR